MDEMWLLVVGIVGTAIFWALMFWKAKKSDEGGEINGNSLMKCRVCGAERRYHDLHYYYLICSKCFFNLKTKGELANYLVGNEEGHEEKVK